MRKHRDELWTWLLPQEPRPLPKEAWQRYGGKWIVFDRKDRLLRLAGKLAPYIDSGWIPSAKYWNRDPGAICVYGLDRDREKLKELLEELGASQAKVWEYDYAWDKNFKRPLEFIYSQMSKMTTILRSYGVLGALRLVREILRPGRGE